MENEINSPPTRGSTHRKHHPPPQLPLKPTKPNVNNKTKPPVPVRPNRTSVAASTPATEESSVKNRIRLFGETNILPIQLTQPTQLLTTNPQVSTDESQSPYYSPKDKRYSVISKSKWKSCEDLSPPVDYNISVSSSPSPKNKRFSISFKSKWKSCENILNDSPTILEEKEKNSFRTPSFRKKEKIKRRSKTFDKPMSPLPVDNVSFQQTENAPEITQEDKSRTFPRNFFRKSSTKKKVLKTESNKESENKNELRSLKKTFLGNDYDIECHIKREGIIENTSNETESNIYNPAEALASDLAAVLHKKISGSQIPETLEFAPEMRFLSLPSPVKDNVGGSMINCRPLSSTYGDMGSLHSAHLSQSEDDSAGYVKFGVLHQSCEKAEDSLNNEDATELSPHAAKPALPTRQQIVNNDFIMPNKFIPSKSLADPRDIISQFDKKESNLHLSNSLRNPNSDSLDNQKRALKSKQAPPVPPRPTKVLHKVHKVKSSAYVCMSSRELDEDKAIPNEIISRSRACTSERTCKTESYHEDNNTYLNTTHLSTENVFLNNDSPDEMEYVDMTSSISFKPQITNTINTTTNTNSVVKRISLECNLNINVFSDINTDLSIPDVLERSTDSAARNEDVINESSTNATDKTHNIIIKAVTDNEEITPPDINADVSKKVATATDVTGIDPEFKETEFIDKPPISFNDNIEENSEYRKLRNCEFGSIRSLQSSEEEDYGDRSTINDGDEKFLEDLSEALYADNIGTSVNADFEEEVHLSNNVSTPEEKEAKRLNKLFNVAKEMASSELEFVRVLRLMEVTFRHKLGDASILNGKPIIEKSQLDIILNQLSQLLPLSETLLADLQERVDNWQSFPKIADVYRKKAMFLKMYSIYVKGFKQGCDVLDDALRRNQQFKTVVEEFESMPECQNLKLKHFMLKPVQRMPQYKMLLESYIKHLSEDEKEFEDAKAALFIVCEVADHADKKILEELNTQKLIKLQLKLGGEYKIVEPGRWYIKDGPVMKVSRKQLQPRHLYLLSDKLISVKQVATNYVISNEIPLVSIRVVKPEQDIDNENEFGIFGLKKSFTLSAASAEKRDAWISAIEGAKDKLLENIESFNAYSSDMALKESGSSNFPGAVAPIWIPDSRVCMCMLCKTAEFNFTVRRHHCRTCGLVVCGTCSNFKAPLLYKSWKIGRVCGYCHTKLYDVIGKGEFPAEYRPMLADSISNEIECLQELFSKKFKKVQVATGAKTLVSAMDKGDKSGLLQQQKARGVWKEYWCVLKDKVLFQFKNRGDPRAQENRPLLGYTVENSVPEVDSSLAPLVFKISHSGIGVLIFRCDTPELKADWVEAIREATIL